MTVILITPQSQKTGMSRLRIVKHNPWGEYHWKGELVQSNQNNNNPKQNKNSQSNNDKLGSTKVRQGSQQGFGEWGRGRKRGSSMV